ncbi:MAG: hypothetical protein WCG02_00160 [Candidatus Taylorbacteria bacterium]
MAKITAIVFGVIFVIAGIWGFFGTVLGLFIFGTLASVVHIIVGLILLMIAARSGVIAALKALGVIYLVFFVLSLLSMTFMGDGPSGWLYFILGLIMLIVAFSGKKGGESVSAPQM